MDSNIVIEKAMLSNVMENFTDESTNLTHEICVRNSRILLCNCVSIFVLICNKYIAG